MSTHGGGRREASTARRKTGENPSPRAKSERANGKRATRSTVPAHGTASNVTESSVQSLFSAVPAPTRVDYALLESDMQRWWDEHDILRKYLHRNDDTAKRWAFMDGPITANNPMGVHHAWGRTYKDLWQRYNTMRGYQQRYQNGFDCQGLWVEVEVEKELGFTSKRQIEEYGIGPFVEKCKERVLRFADRITQQSIRLGEWMDWSDSYYTMSDENNYTIWSFLKTCWERGWVYRGRDVMPWCPRCGTGISDMEINEGRMKVRHTSVYVRMPLVDRPREYLLVWTTTPWTLPANVAAAVNPKLAYAKVEQDGDTYYLSNDVVPKLAKLRGREHGEPKVVGTLHGSDLLGWRYVGPFDDLTAQERASDEHRIVAWEEVSAEEGTGIVHIAPGCGREDFMLAKEHTLPVLAPVDESGVYVDGYDWLTGMHVAEVARPIFEDLKRKGYFYQTESFEHVYPHCWRCKTELIFRLVDEWFISMGSLESADDNLRKRLVRVVEDPAVTTWIPAFGRERELDWLRNMEDWMISKKRYWGLALPIYPCESCGAFEVIGSESELHERAVAGWDEFAGHTPHRPWVDAVKIRCRQCGATVSRIPDVGNPWLDAGIVSFSTLRYRTDRDYWAKWYPADFVTEGFAGQFRNWFYALLVMAAGLEDSAPFKTLLGYGTLLDQNGEEFHKSKGNSIPFDDAADIVGSDTMRWLFASSTPEQNLRFPRIPTEEQAAEMRASGNPPRLSDLWMQVRAPLDKLWNVYSFFVTYANIDGFDPTQRALPVSERSDLDRWMLSELHRAVRDVSAHLSAFNAQHATQHLAELVENLSNWYVRRSRRRFWKSEEDTDKVAAYLTLYECLVTVTKLLAPLTPFLAESLYQNLVRSVDTTAPESVHLADWPEVDVSLISPLLHDETALVMQVVNLGRAAREKAQIRVRQPLSHLFVRVNTEGERASLLRLGDQVLEELNVKNLEFLPPESDMLLYTLRPKLPVLGPRLGKELPRVLAALRGMDAQAAARELREQEKLTLEVDGRMVELSPEEVEVEASAREGYVAAEERGYVVALETTLTPELLAEGLVRDLTHFIQETRKHAGFAIEDSIALALWTDDELAAIVRKHAAYIRDETLARDFAVHIGAPDKSTAGYTETIPAAKLGGHAVTMRVRKR